MDHDVIYLETDEEITSAVDRLHRSPALQVVLVVPRGAVVLQSLMNLKLLKREASNAKKTIGIVTVDTIGRKLAVQAGMAVLESVESRKALIEPEAEQAQEIPQEIDLTVKSKPPVKVHHFQEELEPEPAARGFSKRELKVEPVISQHKPLPQILQISSPRKSRTRALVVAAIIFVVLVAAAAVVVPQAEVTLVVAGEKYERDLDIGVVAAARAPSVEQSQIPGEFAEAETEKMSKFTATGRKNIGEKAKGSAAIFNDAGLDQTLPAQTKLTGSSLVFVTTADISVPKATLNAAGEKVQGKATVQVQAQEAGDRYNVANLNVTVPKDKLTGKVESTTGGSTREVTVVSAEDIAAAKAVLDKQAQDDLKATLQRKSGKVVMDGAVKFETKTVEPSTSEGSEVNEFEMKLVQTAKGLVFQEAVFRETYIALLRQSLPPQKDLAFSSADEIVTQVTEADFTSGEMTVKGTIKTQLVPQINTAVLKKELVAKSLAQAQQIAERTQQVERVAVITRPAWFGRLPLVAARIKVKVEHQ